MSSFPITTLPIDTVLNDISTNVGATLPRQDSIDRRVIQETLDGTGEIISDPSEVGGWIDAVGGVPYIDSDRDGMANEWERANGLDPTRGADRNSDGDSDGYTNLEEFLNNTNPRVSDTNIPPTSDEICVPIRASNGEVSLICL